MILIVFDSSSIIGSKLFTPPIALFNAVHIDSKKDIKDILPFSSLLSSKLA